MIFRSVLNKKTALLQPEMDNLINAVHKQQTHPGDLLLIHINGFYNREAYTWTNLDKPISPYMIGPGSEGYSEALHHEFIGEHLKKNILDKDFDQYKSLVEWNAEREAEIRALETEEAYSIQHEMLLYLKIWEMDAFIKKLYQLTRLAGGQHYDWHFSIAESNRDTKATGSRDKIIREKVRDVLEMEFPQIYATMKNAYKSQLRNSIAHSAYSIHGRYIHLNNYIKEDPASQISVVPFDEWIDIFHDTLVFYSQIARIMAMVDHFFNRVVTQTFETVEIRINRLDPARSVTYHLLKHRPGINHWYWAANDEAAG